MKKLLLLCLLTGCCVCATSAQTVISASELMPDTANKVYITDNILYLPTSAETRSIIFYDVLGRSVLRLSASAVCTRVKIPNLPRGVFVYKIIESDQTVSTGKYISK